MTPDAATRHVVDRCPSCGVEHDVRVDACEACHTPLRYWCRAHGHATGWLESAWCTRCQEEEARRERRDPRPAPPRALAVAPPAAAAPHERVASVLKARLREAAERPAAAPAAPSAAPPAAHPAAMPPAAATVPAAPAATPALAAPREPKAPRLPRRGLGVRLYESLLTVLRTGIVGALIGAVASGIEAYYWAGTEIPLTAVIGGLMGGLVGLGVGVLIAAVFFPRTADRPEE